MPSTDWSSWTGLDLGDIARAGIYSESDVERMRDQLRGYGASVRHGLSDGFSGRLTPMNTIYSSSTSTIAPSEVPVALVVGLAVGGAGLLIFFIVLCCVCCKHRSGGRVLQAPPAAAQSPASPPLHERHNPLSYAAPLGGTALYPMPPGQAGNAPQGAYPAPVLAPYTYTLDIPTVAPDHPPAYDSDRPLLPADGAGGAKAAGF